MRVPEGFAAHPSPYIQPIFRGIVREVIDGDTMIVEVDLGFNRYEWMDLRLFNFNAPESYHPKTDIERRAGIAAKARVKELVEGKPILFVTYPHHEKYGRYLASVFRPILQPSGLPWWQSLETLLVEEGHGLWLDASIEPPTLEHATS